MGGVLEFADDEYAYKYPSWACRVSTATSDSPPGDLSSVQPYLKADISTTLKPTKVVRTAGGHQLDYAEFTWMIDAPLIDRTAQPARFSKMLDVLFPAGQETVYNYLEDGSFGPSLVQGDNRRIAVVDYGVESESVDSREDLSGMGAVHPYLFGVVFPGRRIKIGSSFYTLTGTDAEFNVMLDGVVSRDMSEAYEDTNYHVWLDPEIGLTTAAQLYHGQNAATWTLIDVINTICHYCNKDEWYIRNPVLDEEAAIFADMPDIRDLRMATGRYLPSYLDEILHPLGFNWFVDYDTDIVTNDETELEYEKPIIQIFRKGYAGYGDGTERDPQVLKWQAPGENLNLSESNINGYEISRKISDAVTGIRIFGDKLRAEVTLPLYPGWKEVKDSLTLTDLSIKDGVEYKANPHVHRLWVANEGGDYYHMRTGGLYEINDPPNFDEIFGICRGDDGTADPVRFNSTCYARRRVIEPPLTYKGTTTERVRRDLLLEYTIVDPEAVDPEGEAEWLEVSTEVGGWSVLGDQIGIIFTDDGPPDVLVSEFGSGNLRLRITGTISSDHYLYNVPTDVLDTGYVSGSAQGRLNMTTIPMHDRFCHWYVVGKTSTDRPELETNQYASVLKDDAAGAETHDHRAELLSFAANIIRPMLHAEYNGNFVIPYWTVEYKIGDLLTEIEGRNIGLDQSADPEEHAYMQVTGIEWTLSDEGGPQTRLVVDRGVREFVDDGYTPTYPAMNLLGMKSNMSQTASQYPAVATGMDALLGGRSETSQSSWGSNTSQSGW